MTAWHEVREQAAAPAAGATAWWGPRAFALYLTAYIAAFLGMRLALVHAAGVDDVTEVVFAQSLQWSYEPRQPPLYTWLAYGAFELFGVTLFALAVLRYALIAATFAFFYLGARHTIRDERLALLAALRREPEMPEAYTQLAMAYGRKGDLAHADLASAQAAFARGDTVDPEARSLLRFSAVWVLSVIVLFSFAQTKLPHYISCVYPALALGLAALLHGEYQPSRRWIRGLTVAVLLPVGLIVTALPWIYPMLKPLVHAARAVAIVAQPIAPSWGLAVAGLAVLLALVGVLIGGRRQALAPLAVRFVVLGLVLQTALLVGVGGFAGRLLQAPTMAIAARIRQLPPQTPVYSLELNAPSISFYAGRNYRIENDAGTLAGLTPPYALVLRAESKAMLAGLSLPAPAYDGGGYMLYIVPARPGSP